MSKGRITTGVGGAGGFGLAWAVSFWTTPDPWVPWAVGIVSLGLILAALFWPWIVKLVGNSGGDLPRQSTRGNRSPVIDVSGNAGGNLTVNVGDHFHIQGGAHTEIWERIGPRDEGPDISLWDVFQRITNAEQPIKFVKEIQDFRQKAFDGEIDVWGAESPQGIKKRIPPGYWEFYTIDLDSLFKKSNHGATTKLAETVSSISMPKMIQLETTERQVGIHFASAGGTVDEMEMRKVRAGRISRLYAEAVALRNSVFSLQAVDAESNTKMDELQKRLLKEIHDLAPEQSINLETINIYDESNHPFCALQEPSRTRAMAFSECLMGVKKILGDYR